MSLILKRAETMDKGIMEFKANSFENVGNIFYICAAGFEDRAKGIPESLRTMGKKVFKYCNILKYHSYQQIGEGQKAAEYLEKNEKNEELLNGCLQELSGNKLKTSIIEIDDTLKTNGNLRSTFQTIPSSEVDAIFVDISGMANFLILLSLHQIRASFPDKKIFVLYTEAENYFPRKEEESEILQLAERRNEDDIIRLGELLGASGARETLILPDFKGYFREDFPICIIFFVGYEPSRAIGLLDTYRPNLVVACYGVSPHPYFKWRTEFSRKLHNKLRVFEQYGCSYTEVSTFSIPENIAKLEEIYTSADREGRILYENYNIAITPQCSKLQTVATYLFCQAHPDAQVVFCLPGMFNPKRYSEGIGKAWMYEL